jgi:structure-specific endonuclease subunit SLX1
VFELDCSTLACLAVRALPRSPASPASPQKESAVAMHLPPDRVYNHQNVTIMSTKSIPAFYGCYLLRSIPKPKTTPYVGSTPHILRRWKQHNGLIIGGAFRTARLAGSLRPWEMTCMVYGFPSQIAALQFEWAWDHAHMSRHITPADRLVKDSLKSNGRRPSKRPTLSTRIADLHTLVHSKSFARWPLTLRFFSKDAHQAWTLWDQRSGTRLDLNIPVELALDETNQSKKGKTPADGPIQIPPVLEAVDVGYSSLAEHLDKSTSILDSNKKHTCSVCTSSINSSTSYLVTCPHSGCNAISHLTCLAQHHSGPSLDSQIIPKDIKCPECKRVTPWVNIVKEMSLRMTNETMAQKVVKKWKKTQLDFIPASHIAETEADIDEDAEASMINDQDDSWIFQEFDDYEPNMQYDTQQNHDADFHDIDDELEIYDSNELPPSAQLDSTSILIPKDLIIPDSDWDNVEILD